MKKYYKILLILPLLAVACNSNSSKRLQLGKFTVKIIDVDDRKYGYDIYKDTALLIHQPVIPAASGNSGFMTEKDAEAVAKLVVTKISSRHAPSITKGELDSLKVVHQ
ncbi:hypothetical protein CKK33_06405 [Mucilaginibacter sp. MD40]|uniref:DUF4907 domain-containing protein n=1 Tax=Mucilaginibacter sp. MD40 TaxID=2029590 RepID=UPI000BACDCF2|nr:DUF4907 domain-containing protein [Mucilaginibacter sp. MD40]PAW93143.1 hypothetical protein CKK33_06405 [Mucilaginibacter sp. MD40]